MIDYKDIGIRIRAARMKKGMTQEQLAEAVSVGTPHISHIETGKTVPSLKTLINIINTLDAPRMSYSVLKWRKHNRSFKTGLESWLRIVPSRNGS